MTPLSDALTAAQRRGLAALEKAFVAEKIDSEALHLQLHAMGITDDIDISYLATSLAVLREWGAPVPAETNGAPKQDEPASEKQLGLIRDLMQRSDKYRAAPVPEGLTKVQASDVIGELQKGAYDPQKWQPF